MESFYLAENILTEEGEVVEEGEGGRGEVARERGKR